MREKTIEEKYHELVSYIFCELADYRGILQNVEFDTELTSLEGYEIRGAVKELNKLIWLIEYFHNRD